LELKFDLFWSINVVYFEDILSGFGWVFENGIFKYTDLWVVYLWYNLVDSKFDGGRKIIDDNTISLYSSISTISHHRVGGIIWSQNR
jgi:hypothetical protein